MVCRHILYVGHFSISCHTFGSVGDAPDFDVNYIELTHYLRVYMKHLRQKLETNSAVGTFRYRAGSWLSFG